MEVNWNWSPLGTVAEIDGAGSGNPTLCDGGLGGSGDFAFCPQPNQVVSPNSRRRSARVRVRRSTNLPGSTQGKFSDLMVRGSAGLRLPFLFNGVADIGPDSNLMIPQQWHDRFTGTLRSHHDIPSRRHMAFNTPRVQPLSILSGKPTIIQLMTGLAAFGEYFRLSSLLLMRVMAVHASQRPAFLVTTTPHQSSQLIGTMRVIVAGVAGVQVDGDPFFEWFSWAICKSGPLEIPSARMALRTHFVGPFARQAARVHNALSHRVSRELTMILDVVTCRSVATHARDPQHPCRLVVSIHRPRSVSKPRVVTIEATGGGRTGKIS